MSSVAIPGHLFASADEAPLDLDAEGKCLNIRDKALVSTRVPRPGVDKDPFLGTVLHYDNQTITLEVEKAGRLTIPFDSLVWLRVKRPQTRGETALRQAVEGGKYFAIGGALIVGLFSSASAAADDDPNTTKTTALKSTVIGGAILGVTGALLGAGIGAVFPTDRWEEVPLERLRRERAQR